MKKTTLFISALLLLVSIAATSCIKGPGTNPRDPWENPGGKGGNNGGGHNGGGRDSTISDPGNGGKGGDNGGTTDPHDGHNGSGGRDGNNIPF